MKYYEVKLHVAPDATEIIAGFLSNYGIEQLQFNDVSSDETDITFYLDENEESVDLIQDIKISAMKLKSDEMYGQYENLGRMYVESNLVDDVDWKDKWKDDFRSFRASDRFGIKPSWDPENPEGEFIIEIDPGMAFGTGAHETTKLCLRCLESTISAGDRVLDIGTGSGILSIAASLLGAGEVKAIDNDSDATMVALDNFRINGVDEDIDLSTDDILKGLDYKADIIVANLITSLIVEIVEGLRSNLSVGGIVIFSGILVEEKDKVLSALEKNGYMIDSTDEEGEWFLVKARVDG